MSRASAGLALRARIVLACAGGGGNVAVAARLGVNFKTVSRWRARFLRDQLDGLTDDRARECRGPSPMPRSRRWWCAPLEEVPAGAAHWSKRELARQAGISPSSVLRIWHAFGLQPWRAETFKAPTQVSAARWALALPRSAALVKGFARAVQ